MYNYTYLRPYQILMIAILTKWLPFYKKNEFYFAAVAVRGRYRGGPGGLDPPFRATYRGILGVWTPILGQHF